MRHYTQLLRATLMASLMLVLRAEAAVAGPYEDGVAAANRGDYATAYRLWRPLADEGNDPDAQNQIGVMYDSGQGVSQNYAEAMKWYRLAADQGNPNAQNNLGHMYRNGEGAPQDYVQAHMWFNLAASRIPASEKKERDNAIEARDFTASKMTPAQIAEAQRLAREWKPKPER
jgi:hypothetical protein